MRRISFLIALTLLLRANFSRSADLTAALFPIPGMRSGILGKAPPGDHWIWLSVPGPRSYPITILYISTRSFRTVDLERLIVVPAWSFRTAEELTHEAVRSKECPNDTVALNLFSVEVVEKSRGNQYRCALPQEQACELLARLRNSPNIDWNAKTIKPLEEFSHSIQCRPDLGLKGEE